jgi:hypothetical protein
MSSHDFPVAGPDKGHEFPLARQANLVHVPIVMKPGTTDNIIKAGAPTTNANIHPIWQFPGDNKTTATKAA